MKAIHRITRNDGDFVGAFRQNVIRVFGNYGKEQEPDEYEEKIKAKQQAPARYRNLTMTLSEG